MRTINIFIYHGVEGYPDKNWYPELQRRLEEQKEIFASLSIRIKIHRFQFPTQLPEGIVPSENMQCKYPLTFENQTRDKWRMTGIIARRGCPPRNALIVAHSLGALNALRDAEEAGERKKPYLGVIAVSPVGGHIDGLDPACYEDGRLESFYRNLNGKHVKDGANEILVYIGKGDKDVPNKQSIELAVKCGVPPENIREIPKGMHLNFQTDPKAIKSFLDHLVPQIVKMIAEAPPQYTMKRMPHRLNPVAARRQYSL